MKPKEGLGMKILKSILNYIPLATFIIFVVTDGIISLTSALIFVISTIGLLINWKRKKTEMKNLENSSLKGVLNMKFPFYDAPNTATITCCHILENGEPILYVSHDEDDGMWQFLCGKAHETDEAKLVSLKSVFDLDNSVGILKDMPCGYYAERKAQDDEWSVRKR